MKKTTKKATKKAWVCPTHLGVFGKEAWKKLYPILIKDGRLAKEDEITFTFLCSSYQELRASDEIIRKDGLTVLDNRGSIKRHPLLVTRRTAFDAFLKLCGKFGLNPLDRQKLNIAASSPEFDETEKFFFGGKR